MFRTSETLIEFIDPDDGEYVHISSGYNSCIISQSNFDELMFHVCDMFTKANSNANLALITQIGKMHFNIQELEYANGESTTR